MRNRREFTPYTVLLLLPDYIASNYGQDTYLAHVLGRSAREAISRAQREAIRAPGTQEGGDFRDWYPLAAFRGHLEDISTAYGGCL